MKNKESKKKIWPMVLSLILSLVIGVGAGAFVWRYYKNQQRTQSVNEPADNAENTQVTGDTIVYGGKRYQYNTDLTNILFMGVDKQEAVTLGSMPGRAGQADCIMLVSLNKTDKTARILQISRDSMTAVDIYDASGNYYTSVEAQLATQYAYGNGGQSSIWAMKKTVSELLYDMPIAGCFSMTIEGISTLNDAIGGVSITVPEDYTDIDPAFVQGTTLTLTGEQAEKYVRKRDINMEGSNSGRMQRQVQYITALLTQIKSQMSNSMDFYGTYYPLVESDVVTDLSAAELNDMASYTYLTDEVAYVPGEVVPGEVNEEYHVDEAELQKLLVKMFYKEI